MRVSRQLLILALIYWRINCSLYDEDDAVKKGYPYDIDLPSVLHKYDIHNLESIIEAKRVLQEKTDENANDEIDYGTYEESYRDYRREYSDWYLRNYDESLNDAPPKSKICETQGCRQAATELKDGLDISADPCHDFDSFACGGWRSHNPIPKSQSQWTQFTKLWYHEEALLRNIIERQANSSDNSSAALIYSWYASCLNETQREQSGDKPLLQIITQFGSCPLLGSFTWFPFGSSFVDNLVFMNRLAIHPFFLLTPRNDLVNSSRVLLTVSPSKLLLRSPNFYIGSETYYRNVRHSYIKLMIHLVLKIRKSMGTDLIYSEIILFRNQIANILRLEKYIAQVLLRMKRITYHVMSLNRLQREISWFPWKFYIKKLYANVKQKKAITGNEMIAIFKLDALKKITRILKLTPKSVKANFLAWNILYQFTGDISADYEKVRHKFVIAMYGKQQRKTRWRECVSSTSAALSMAVGKLFVEEAFDERSKNKAEKIIEDIRQQLIKDFENLSWMDENTTKNAEEKAKAVLKNVGFPKFILNDTLVVMYYKGMSFSREKFFSNIIQRRLIISRNALMSREAKPDRQRWSMGPQEINAYYSLDYNKIVFPAAILQRPFWHASYPMSMQFGGLGYVVGHEISHGFDVNGMHYDKNGNYIAWCTNSSMKAFKAKSQCLSEQYSNYTIFGKHINGVSSLGENIADNGGIRLAYKAYKEWLKNNTDDEKRLPDVPFTHEQLFFLKGAQIWCANIHRRVALNMIDTDPHVLKMFRIIGPFSNFVAFSEAFKCPVGSRMNPVKKCRVW